MSSGFDVRKDLVAVIMAGGAGTRFWPASTKDKPKQFLTFFGDRSLLQQSHDRVASLVGSDRVLVVTSAAFVDLVRQQLPELPVANIIGEPVRKDTAAAVALAAVLVEKRFGDVVMAVLTADHLIGPVDSFQRTLTSAARGAAAGPHLYTFGVVPTFPATGYGYLELGARVTDESVLPQDDVHHFALARFVEKPPEATARQYLEGGKHLWNSGMFVWRTSTILGELERNLPAHLAALRPVAAADGTPGFAAALQVAFDTVPRISIDYAVMEKSKAVRAVQARFDWSDVGSFPALVDHLPRDEHGNATRGRVFVEQAGNNLVFSDDPKELIALIGVHDLVVVRAGNRTLVAPRARAEEIKALVAKLPPDEQ